MQAACHTEQKFENEHALQDDLTPTRKRKVISVNNVVFAAKVKHSNLFMMYQNHKSIGNLRRRHG